MYTYLNKSVTHVDMSARHGTARFSNRRPRANPNKEQRRVAKSMGRRTDFVAPQHMQAHGLRGRLVAHELIVCVNMCVRMREHMHVCVCTCVCRSSMHACGLHRAHISCIISGSIRRQEQTHKRAHRGEPSSSTMGVLERMPKNSKESAILNASSSMS